MTSSVDSIFRSNHTFQLTDAQHFHDWKLYCFEKSLRASSRIRTGNKRRPPVAADYLIVSVAELVAHFELHRELGANY